MKKKRKYLLEVKYLLQDGEKTNIAEGKKKEYDNGEEVLEDFYVVERINEFRGMPILNRSIKIIICE